MNINKDRILQAVDGMQKFTALIGIVDMFTSTLSDSAGVDPAHVAKLVCDVGNLRGFVEDIESASRVLKTAVACAQETTDGEEYYPTFTLADVVAILEEIILLSEEPEVRPNAKFHDWSHRASKSI